MRGVPLRCRRADLEQADRFHTNPSVRQLDFEAAVRKRRWRGLEEARGRREERHALVSNRFADLENPAYALLSPSMHRDFANLECKKSTYR